MYVDTRWPDIAQVAQTTSPSGRVIDSVVRGEVVTNR